jgi:type II secretory pathway component HofQ
MFPRKSSASVRLTAAERTVEIEFHDTGAAVIASMRVSEKSETLQESTYTADITSDAPGGGGGRRYTGAPISIRVKDAEIKDLLRTFSQLTGTTITYPPDLEGTVNLDVRDMPWDEAFDVVLRQHNLRYEIDGKNIVVKR